MTQIYDEDALRRLIAEHAQRGAELQAKMDAINATLLEIQRRPPLPVDLVLMPVLRAEFEQALVTMTALQADAQRHVNALKALTRPNLPSA